VNILWKKILSQSIVSAEELQKYVAVNVNDVKKTSVTYPMQINPYVLQLIKEKGSSISKQYIPDIRELDDKIGMEDPLAEERDSPVPGITHRYPDRVLFLVSNVCPSICRFCTRKRKAGKWKGLTKEQLMQGIDYIRNNVNIRDVLLSGGDPLLLQDDHLEFILSEIRNIPHVEIIRIGTRTITALPMRITPSLVRIIKKYNPVFINFHINHPDEITAESRAAISLLVDNGIVLGSQTVLLRSINDNAEIIIKLMRELLKLRVRPYYILQADLVKGTDHFRTRVEKGIEIMKKMRGFVSGLANPYFVIDLPGGGGKVPVIPDYIKNLSADKVIVENYTGDIYTYPQPKE